MIPFIPFSLLQKSFPEKYITEYALASLFFYILYLLIVWLYFFIMWTDYYLDVWILTGDKIVAIELCGLFHRVVSEFSLERIQDVTVITSGIMQSIFGFGTIRVQTAGEKQDHLFLNAARPDHAKSLIVHFHEKSLHSARLPKSL